MKEGRASRTAAGAALLRAIESRRPAHERVCHDPYAKQFVEAKYYLLPRNRLLARLGLWLSERRIPTIYGQVVARTRYIDDYLRTCIADGIEQLVILGAGYDTRAYRIAELRGGVRVFEVDHPATQERKIAGLGEILPRLPDHVVYVPVDFEKERLEERLFECGYGRSRKTLFTLEAVTMYITAEAMDETLSFVADKSGKGSSIIFDYCFLSVVNGTCKMKGAGKLRKFTMTQNEPLRFGIEEDGIEQFLAERGYHQVENLGGELAESEYFRPLNRKTEVPRFGGIVHATVKDRE